MEDNNHGIPDKFILNIFDNQCFLPDEDSDTNIFYNTKANDTKIEPKVEDFTNELFNIEDCDDIIYVLNDISCNLNDSDAFHDEQSFPLMSVTSDSQTPQMASSQCSTADLCSESPYHHTASMSSNINRPELKKLLSPLSLGSPHPSANENLSIDSSQSSYTINSLPAAQASLYDLCAICTDLATGKHYGVLACEGCKGFFKRTIRKKLHYTCREKNICPITERLRNRCQSCRFNKCLDQGMKIEAVQRERSVQQRPTSPESKVTDPIPIITAENILQNEISYYCVENSNSEELSTVEIDEAKLLCSVINKQLFNLVMWAKSVPGFSHLEKCDQMVLLNKCWVEILIASFSFRSSVESEFGSIRMDNVHRLSLSVASKLGLGNLMIRILRELIMSLKYIKVDQMEIACLKTIILFDSNYVNLRNPELIAQFRYRIFEILKQYVSHKYPEQPFRIYKILLKLTSLRGFTASFVATMKSILTNNSNNKTSDINTDPTIENIDNNNSKSDVLYPLFSEMMKQKDYPYL